MQIERVWAMPNKWTFASKPISKLIKEEFNGGLWVDPYAGKNSPAQVTNDLNPQMDSQYHLDALEFLKQQNDNTYDGCLYDPPYSLRQLKESYESVGMTELPKQWGFSKYYRAAMKNEIGRIIKPGGKALSFCWNSNGIGKCRGFELERVLLVAHGGSHNDTIVTVERKVNGTLT